VISDAHGGIKAAIGQVLTGASWQRCRTHYAESRIMPSWGREPLAGVGLGLALSA